MNDKADNLRRIHQEAESKQKVAGLKKIGDKKRIKIKEQQDLSKADDDFYAEIGRKRTKVCFECGCFLGYKLKKWNYHHLLAKAKYPQHRHNELNIVLLCLTCHSKIETNSDFMPKTNSLLKTVEEKLLK